MPIRVGKIRDTGGIVFLHYCEVCGKDAQFGTGVSILKALKAADKKQLELAKKHLGKWCCDEHRQEDNKEAEILASDN